MTDEVGGRAGSRAAIAGLVFFALYVAAFVVLGRIPDAEASPESTIDFYSIFVVFALRAAGVFIAAGATRSLRSGLIPRWFALISYAAVVVLLLTAARVRAVSLLFPTWVFVMSLIVLIKRPGERRIGSA